jgi:hypothetical protein
MTMPSDDRRLFDAFVAELRALGKSPEGLDVEGISARTLRRYLVDDVVPSRLEPETRLAMARYLASRGRGEFGYSDGGAGTADDHGPDAWSDPFIEVMLREARAAEKRAEAAASWARWLELEARNRAGAHEMMREQRRAMRAQVIPSTPPGEEEESRSA